ncbi:MAG: lysophospholipid acyltransferase family protein [Bacteroidota bacterium]
MQGFLFFILVRLLYFLSWLPFPVLYAVSDLMYVIVYRLIKYRKKVVIQNLERSFPEKSSEEIQTIAKAYYHYLCDLILETFKTLTITKEEAIRRCRFHDLTLFRKLYAENKNIILVMGHYGNWEWAGSTMSLETAYQLYVIYHPLSNKYFDQLIYDMRSRFGTKLIPMNNTFRDMVKNKSIVNATAFIADQTPPAERAYWTTFLNQETPIFEGTAKIAKKLNYPIVFVNVKRTKRGYYEIFTEVLVEHPQLLSEEEISELHTRRLEQEIIKQPEIWLWSHKRWKHKKPSQLITVAKNSTAPVST